MNNLNKKYLVGTLLLGNTLLWVDRSLISTAMIPISKELNLTSSNIGLILSIFFLGNALLMIPSGWLSGKYGAKKVIVTCITLIAIFSILFGITSSFIMFIIARFFIGIGNAGIPSATSQVIAQEFEAEKKSFVQSVILSSTGLGGIIAFVVGVAIVNHSWRMAYIGLGILTFVILVIQLIYIPKDKKITNNQSNRNLKKLLKNKNVYLLTLAMLFLNVLLGGVISWAPMYFVSQFNLQLSEIGYLLTINAVFQTLGTVLAGIVLSKLFLHKEKAFILIMASCAAVCIILLGISTSFMLSSFLLIGVSITAVSVFTTLFTWPHKLFSGSDVGLLIAIINTGGTLGGLLAPLIIGNMMTTNVLGTISIFILLGVASILSGLVVQFINDEYSLYR